MRDKLTTRLVEPDLMARQYMNLDSFRICEK